MKRIIVKTRATEENNRKRTTEENNRKRTTGREQQKRTTGREQQKRIGKEQAKSYDDGKREYRISNK